MSDRFNKRILNGLVKKGHGITSAAIELGCSAGTLKAHCESVGFEFPRQSRKNTGVRPAKAQECKVTKGFELHSPLLRQLWA